MEEWEEHRRHSPFNLICHVFWKGGRRAMRMNSKPSFRSVATGTCYWCVIASCYLITFKMHFSFPESDLRLSCSKLLQGCFPLCVFIFQGLWVLHETFIEFRLETIEVRNLLFCGLSYPSYRALSEILVFFLDNSWTNQNHYTQSRAVFNICLCSHHFRCT